MTEPAPPEAPSRADPASDAALRRYAARMRPWRIAYAAGIAVAALVLLSIVKIAYNHGEISHAKLDTAASAPPSISPASPTAIPAQAWRTSDATALGYPSYGGTVITYDRHAVRGRDARTGAITWSYTRTDRTLCAAMQTEGVTVAVYEVNGNCDEATGLDTGTGARRWTRTLDKDSNVTDHAVNGLPHYAVGPFTVLIWTSSVIYAIDPSGDQDVGVKSGGLDRWVFAHTGCTIGDVVLGTTGALISQTCTGQDCTALKFCGNGTQLLLRDPTTGEKTDGNKNNGNPDQITWNRIGSDLVPVSADLVVSARTSDGTELDVLSAAKGVVDARLALSGGTGATVTTPADDADLITFGGITYALEADRTEFTWRTETAGAPTVTGVSGSGVPTLDLARITVATSRGIATLAPSTGSASQAFAVPAPAAGSTVYPLGSGFLVAGSETLVYR